MWRRGTVLSLIAWAASTNKFIPKRAAECRVERSLSKIKSAIQALQNQNIKPTQVKVKDQSGLGVATVKRHWKAVKKRYH